MPESRSSHLTTATGTGTGTGGECAADGTAPGTPLLTLGKKARRDLTRIAARHSGEYRLVVRARMMLSANEAGATITRIATVHGVSSRTVARRLDRYRRHGIRGLFDAPRSGRPEIHGPSTRLLILATATSTPPDAETHWTLRLIHDELDTRGYRVSRSTVGRVLREARIRPHKVRGWLNRRDDPEFWDQAAQVCRLYLNPPPGTLLVSVDEKTGIQARSRRYPTRIRDDGSSRREFEYRRHGTVSIIAAMNVATGEVITERIEANDSVTFTGFLARLDALVQAGTGIHLIMDNGSSHTSKATRAWLAARPRFAVTYTPKHASWLNMVEQFFSVLTRRTLRHGDFGSRDDLAAKIDTFTIRYNETARPIAWRYDAAADHARYLRRHPNPDEVLPAAA